MVYLNKNKTLKPVMKPALKIVDTRVANSDTDSAIEGFSEASQKVSFT
jgi:ribosomal protein S20